MHSGPGQTQKEFDQSDLDDRSVEELKGKAIAAKERAYCRLKLSITLHSVTLNIFLTGPSQVNETPMLPAIQKRDFLFSLDYTSLFIPLIHCFVCTIYAS